MLGWGVNFDVPSDAATSSSDKHLSWRDNKPTWANFAGTGSVQTAKRPPLRALGPRPQSPTASQTDVHASDQHIPWFSAPRDWYGAIPALPPSPQCPTASQTGLHPSDQHIQWSLDPRDLYGATYQSSTQLQPPLPYQPTSAQALHHQPPPNQQYQPFYFHQGTHFHPSMPPVCGPEQQLLQQQQVYQQPQNACSAKRCPQPPLHKPATHACPSNSAASRAQLYEENSSRPIASVLSTQGKAGLSSGLKPLDVSLATGTSRLPAQSAMQRSTPNAPHRPRLGTLSQKHSLSNQEVQAAQSAGHAQTKSPGTTQQATRPQASTFSTVKPPNPQHDRLQAPPVPHFSLPAPRVMTTGTPKPHGHFPDQQLLSTQQNLPLPRTLSLSPSHSKCISTDSERDRDTLGVDESATQEEIRAAYWKREFEYHPARHREATPEVQARVAEKLTKAQAAVDRLKGFDGMTWGAWEGLEAYSNPFGLRGMNKSG